MGCWNWKRTGERLTPVLEAPPIRRLGLRHDYWGMLGASRDNFCVP